VAVPQRLTLVTLGVADVARATDFYEALGWRRSSASQEGEITFLRMQGSALALYSRRSLAEDAGLSPDGSGFGGIVLALNCDSRDEVDAVHAEWVAAGAAHVKAPEELAWGGYVGYVADPDGHLWEIAHNPYMPNDEQGLLGLPD
jgi:uncharacterized glyoxalase superfamily protein PhnB